LITKKHIIIAVAALVVFWLTLHVLALKNQTSPVRRDEIPKPASHKRRVNTRKLVPDNPSDYGIVIVTDEESVAEQEKVNAQIKHVIEDLKNKQTPEVWEKVQKVIEEDPKVTQEKIEKVDEKIKELQEKLKAVPDDEDTQKRIRRLMMLRSISQELTK